MDDTTKCSIQSEQNSGYTVETESIPIESSSSTSEDGMRVKLWSSVPAFNFDLIALSAILVQRLDLLTYKLYCLAIYPITKLDLFKVLQVPNANKVNGLLLIIKQHQFKLLELCH